jgi:ferritin-like metal-binding protein YciE
MSDLIINVLDLRAVGWATHGFAGAPLSSGRPTQPRAEFGPSGSIQLNGTLSIQESYENSPSVGLFDFQEDDVGLFSKDIKTMDDLLLHGLQDIYYAEQQITKALPKMIDLASNRDLALGLKLHLEETNKQIERLEQVFKKLGKKPSGTDCPAIDGLIKESDETSGEIEDKSVLDAAIVASAQAVEHYEIARYGTLIAWAEELGHDDIVRFLTTNLNEEKAANTKLNTIALRKGVNRKAAS